MTVQFVCRNINWLALNNLCRKAPEMSIENGIFFQKAERVCLLLVNEIQAGG